MQLHVVETTGDVHTSISGACLQFAVEILGFYASISRVGPEGTVQTKKADGSISGMDVPDEFTRHTNFQANRFLAKVEIPRRGDSHLDIDVVAALMLNDLNSVSSNRPALSGQRGVDSVGCCCPDDYRSIPRTDS